MQISASLLVTVVYGWEARKPLVGFGYFSNNSEIWRGFEPAGIFNFSRKANILCRSQAATPTFCRNLAGNPKTKLFVEIYLPQKTNLQKFGTLTPNATMGLCLGAFTLRISSFGAGTL